MPFRRRRGGRRDREPRRGAAGARHTDRGSPSSIESTPRARPRDRPGRTRYPLSRPGAVSVFTGARSARGDRPLPGGVRADDGETPVPDLVRDLLPHRSQLVACLRRPRGPPANAGSSFTALAGLATRSSPPAPAPGSGDPCANRRARSPSARPSVEGVTLASPTPPRASEQSRRHRRLFRRPDPDHDGAARRGDRGGNAGSSMSAFTRARRANST